MTNIAKEEVALEGYRIFTVDFTSGIPVLAGQFRGQAWDSSVMQAECLSPNSNHLKNADLKALCETHLRAGECSCGIYVVPEEKKVLHTYWTSLRRNHQTIEIEAKVSAWGICIEGTNALKCQFARIIELTMLIPVCCKCALPAEFFGPKGNNFCAVCQKGEINLPSMEISFSPISPDSLNSESPVIGVMSAMNMMRWDDLGNALELKYGVPVHVQPLLSVQTAELYSDILDELSYPTPDHITRKVAK